MNAPSESETTPLRPPSKFAFGLTALALAGVALVLSAPAGRGPQVVLGRNWPAEERLSIDEIDHRAWDRLLQKFVDDEGSVDYAGWSESPTDVRSLDDYLTSLSRAEPSREASREARLAFWINAYNAATVRGIVRDYPAAVAGRGGRQDRFELRDELLLRVGTAAYSLGEIENQLLRPMREPRIHFAVVCGSRGCPRLLNRAYRTGEVERQLRENSRHFFADPQKLRYDESTGQLQLSPILKWYAQDFGGTEQELLEAIGPYLPDRVKHQRRGARGLSDQYLEYDWDLNDRAPDAPPVPPNASP